jgi:hypothetical protein
MGAAACFFGTHDRSWRMMRGPSAPLRAALLMLRAHSGVAGAARTRTPGRSARREMQAASVAAVSAIGPPALAAPPARPGL